jgi:hypothetical protein
VRLTLGTALLAGAIGAGAHAGEPAGQPPDLWSEIAWARATWRDELKGLHFHGPLANLLAWAPRRGSVAVFLYTEDFACRRATLTRAEPPEIAEDNRDAENHGDVQRGWPALILKINHRSRIDEEGDRVREVTFIEVGLRLSREDETTTEARGADGRWKPWSSAGYGFEPIVYGALSSVDDRVARWDGDPMELYTYCRGPVEWLACPGGGERPCERCEEVSLRVGAPLSLGGRSRNYGKRPITCHDRCPDYPRSPDIARLHQLEARVQVWRPRKAPIARVPSLYRSREDCLREHPAVR